LVTLLEPEDEVEDDEPEVVELDPLLVVEALTAELNVGEAVALRSWNRLPKLLVTESWTSMA